MTGYRRTVALLNDAAKRRAEERKRAWDEALRKLVAREPLTQAEIQMVREALERPLLVR